MYYILTCLIMPVCRWLKSVGNATKGLVCTRVWSAVCLTMMCQSSSSTVTNVEYAALEEKRTSSTATPVATAWTSNWKDPTKWATKVAALPFSISKGTVQCFTLCEACLWTAFAEVMHIIYWVYDEYQWITVGSLLPSHLYAASLHDLYVGFSVVE